MFLNYNNLKVLKPERVDNRLFDLDECIAFITNKAAKKMADAFNERLKPLGMTRVQWTALYYLGKCDGISQKELAEKMNIKSSTVARLIDRMENDKLVIRSEDPEDRRAVKLVLTEKGKDLREKLLPEGEKMSKVFANGLTDEEIEIFLKVINKMVENIS